MSSTEQGYGPAWQRLRLVILQRDRYVCHWCRQLGADSVDHVVPKIEGGTDVPQNLVAAHRSCNARRSIQWHNAHPDRIPTGRSTNRWHTIRRRAYTRPTGVLADDPRSSVRR